ncbi:anhydro-N-acetylmuramic acid kinase [Vibrio sp. WXL103]|uniref:anhydro-N-acetylmuramic acid kinase n=1 Tax=Vibrio sp. WXL103 TaxID=3450710 RepID=UPI003EC8A5FA
MRELYIGLMSGTSLDGIDAAVVAIDNTSIELVASHEHPIPNSIRQQVLAMCTGQPTSLPAVGLLDHQLGHLYADAVNALLTRSGLCAEQITAIGNHGQTVYHQPSGEYPFTIQLGDANLIAAITGIDTIADFRRLDMALGGQGAPLVPAFHQFLFGQQDSTNIVLNIGGIANLSVLPAKGEVIGFDTGPGNMLMDAWCEKHTGAPFDQDAALAKQGNLIPRLLRQLLSDPYLSMPAPKSTGREHYNLAWLETQLEPSDSAADVQRTLCEFTAQSIALHVSPYQQGRQCRLTLCGGGARNPLLVERLAALLPDWQLKLTSDLGVDADFMEAMAFAWLARQKVHNLPSNLPAVTGARCPASLGVIYPAIKDCYES